MRVVIVGLGSIAVKHCHALRSIHPNVEIYALRSSPNSDKKEGIKHIYSYTEISKLNPAFIIISNPTSKHKETISALLSYHIPLFIEKPVFHTLDVHPLMADIQRYDIKTYVACNLRFLGCLNFTKDFIVNKRINEVNTYCGSYLPDWRPNVDYRDVYSARAELGGGVHIDLIHEIDYMVWLFGFPESSSSYKSNRSSLKISAFDYANYLLQYNEFCGNIVLNYYRRDAKRTLEILLEDGTLSVDLLQNTVHWKGSLIYSSTKTVADTYQEQMRYFVENILAGKIEFNDVKESFKILEICLKKD